MTPLRRSRLGVDPPRRNRLRVGVLIALSLLAALAGVLAAAGGRSTSPPAITPSPTLPGVPVVVGTRAAPAPVPATGLRAPVNAAQLSHARSVAARFLAGYLPYLYGHRHARSLLDLAPALRAELAHDPPRLTPAQRSRHPRLVALAAVGRPGGRVLATATVAGGGAAAYPVRLLLTRRAHQWVVTAIAP